MNEIFDLFNIIATIITIVSTTIAIILWFRYRERDKWIYSNLMTSLEGLNRVIFYTKQKPQKDTLNRISDMVITIRDNIVSSMKTIDSKRNDRLKSWKFGFKDESDLANEFTYGIAEQSHAGFSDLMGKFKKKDKKHPKGGAKILSKNDLDKLSE